MKIIVHRAVGEELRWPPGRRRKGDLPDVVTYTSFQVEAPGVIYHLRRYSTGEVVRRVNMRPHSGPFPDNEYTRALLEEAGK